MHLINPNYIFFVKFLTILCLTVPAGSLNIKRYILSTHAKKQSYISDTDTMENNIYKTKKNMLNQGSIPDIDVGYLLTKLSDEEILNLLRDETPKTEQYGYDSDHQNFYFNDDNKQRENSNTYESAPQTAIFRLEDKEVDPYSINYKNKDKHAEVERHLKNILYKSPKYDFVQENDDDDEIHNNKLFEQLVNQLKVLCSKKKKFNSLLSQETKKEHMFLVLNDAIESKFHDELITVDPNTLSENSSIILLGPMTKDITDDQLLRIMKRIENELSKVEYAPFFDHISKGLMLKDNDILMKNVISGSTRRYIKPHRCNYQSKLARVYGGPKWLICTGYININTPSLYD